MNAVGIETLITSKPKEIGIALSHYHQKIGPRFVGIFYDFSKFSTLAQYNILSDSISSRSDELVFFVENLNKEKFTIHVKKINVIDTSARGNIQKFAVLLFIPPSSNEFRFFFNGIIDKIVEDIKKTLIEGMDLRKNMKKWYSLLNDSWSETNECSKEGNNSDLFQYPTIDS